MKAEGIVFLYDRKLGNPEQISKQFSEHFSEISENLVKENLLSLSDLKSIMDNKTIFWGGIKQNFEKILLDSDAIGTISWDVYKSHTGKECSEDVKSLIYNNDENSWNFPLIVSVLSIE